MLTRSSSEVQVTGDPSGQQETRLAIEAKGVGFAYPGNVVMLDTSFEVREGEFVSIIGPSGCGKSTLLLMVAGLLAPNRGEIRIYGERVDGPGSSRSMVFQNFALMPWKSALDNVLTGLRYRSDGLSKREKRDVAMEYLHKVGLGGFDKHLPSQLSGGMQQRVGLARAFAARSQILLMDEPFAAIDAQNAEVMREELRELVAKEARTIVFVTHNLDEALSLADRILLMRTRPGMIAEDVAIDLAQPRGAEATSPDDRLKYSEYRARMWDHLRNEIFRERSLQREELPTTTAGESPT